MSKGKNMNRRGCSWLLIIAIGGLIGFPDEPHWYQILSGYMLIAIGFAGAKFGCGMAIPSAVLGLVVSVFFISYPTSPGMFVAIAVSGAVTGLLLGALLDREPTADE